MQAGAAVDESLPLLFTAISGASPLRRLDDCAAWSQVDTVLVQVQETLAWPRMRIGGQIVDPRRPDRFGPSFGSERSIVCPGVHFREFLFNDRRRGFDAIVVSGPRTPSEDLAHAYAVLDTFRVGPPTVSTFCTVAEDVAKLYPGRGSLAADAEGAVGRLRRVAPFRSVANALETVEPALTDLDEFTPVKWQQQLTTHERRALQVVDDALQRCGLGNEIFVPTS